jgi:Cdc6-like AAA superfamily ATPase
MTITEHNIHKNIILKMDNYIKNNNIPNIIFHGPTGSGKKFIINNTIEKLYDKSNINYFVMYVNCAHGKGIKFIREDLKHFSKTNILNTNNVNFKTVVLVNADKLTIDAQSALRRCIEIYNHSTRFFIIVEDKFKILKPILSRFSDIYCNKKININYDKKNKYDFFSKKIYYLSKLIILDDKINNLSNSDKMLYILNLTNKLYNNGFTANMLLYYIKNKLPESKNKYKFLFILDIHKREIRNELLIIMFCLNYIYFRNNVNLKNIGSI